MIHILFLATVFTNYHMEIVVDTKLRKLNLTSFFFESFHFLFYFFLKQFRGKYCTCTPLHFILVTFQDLIAVWCLHVFPIAVEVASRCTSFHH